MVILEKGRCIYRGFWVGKDSAIPNTDGIRNDVIAALKEIKIPVLRWLGGCFADEYHWRDGCWGLSPIYAAMWEAVLFRR